MSSSLTLMTYAALLMSLWEVTKPQCPWNQEGLSLWSDPNTWNDGQVPGFEAEVNITRRVLLDLQPPSLANITIQPQAALVWGNINHVVLNVTYIHVLGELHIGSEKCRFRKKATINFYGRVDSKYMVPEFGYKFLGVGSGGTLEIHGLKKMSWTKLAHTVPAAADLTCGLLYDHQTAVLGRETRKGVHVLLWTSDGSVRDFNVFTSDTFHLLPDFLHKVPPDTVLGVATMGLLPSALPDSLITHLGYLGATWCRGVTNSTALAFVVRTGEPSTLREQCLTSDYARLIDWTRGLEFRVASLRTPDFKVMNAELTNPKITVSHDVSSWLVGDDIVVTSTDFDWRQAELKTIVDCTDCDWNQIRLDSPFQYTHFGEITHNVDERAEVALLSRNILLQGQLEDNCHVVTDYDQWLCNKFGRDLFGGQMKAILGSTARVQGAEFSRMGQQTIVGAYPLHFHLINDATGMWFRNNSIHHSLARCVTVHATFNAEVSDNVCYIHLGHGYFLEDSVEQNITLHRNLGVGMTHGAILLSERKKDWCGDLRKYCDALGTFWITHPNNYLTDNVAAGSDGHGYFYVFADSPLGISKSIPWIREKTPPGSLQYHPITKFSDNTAHSNHDSGIFFDSLLSVGQNDNNVFVPENGVIPTAPHYDPRHPPTKEGVPVWTTMEGMTLYKNRVQNSWVKGGNIQIVNSSFADSQRGHTGGTISGEASGTMVKNCLFVGQTDNKGMRSTFVDRSIAGNPSVELEYSFGSNPYATCAGINMYQGPVMVEGCHFSGYRHLWWADHWQQEHGTRPVRIGAAISFKSDSVYPSTPWSYVKDVKFTDCDNVNDANWLFRGNATTYGWDERDGNLANTFRDVDGSLTGQPGTQLVPPHPFYTGSECTDHPNWHMVACPYRYVQLEVLGREGVLNRRKRAKFPMTLRRDDRPLHPMSVQGVQKNKYLLRTHKSYTITFNSSLGNVPRFFDVRAYGMERDDVIRVALCLPRATTRFEIRSYYPSITGQTPHIMAFSLAELDSDVTGRKFFWDADVGLLYFKFLTNETRQNSTEMCANGICLQYRITRLNGGGGPADCSSYNNTAIVDTTPAPQSPTPRSCSGLPDSADGAGAVPKDVVVANPFNITCLALDPPPPDRRSVQYRGCYKDKSLSRDMQQSEIKLTLAMTRQICQDRCYSRGYLYCGLSLGVRCVCGDTFGLHGVLDDDRCSSKCKGDKSLTCGAKNRLEVYYTGLPLKPIPARCGPNNAGDVFGNQCLYLAPQVVSVGRAQRECVLLGGNLAAIDSQDKQTAVEQYLREHKMVGEAWMGVNHVVDPAVWQWRDGARLGTFSFWKTNSGSDPDKHFVYVSGQDRYRWIQSKDTASARAASLCDLPITAVPQLEPCGLRGSGRRLGPSGQCYLVVHDDMSQTTASYLCHLAGGALATYSNRSTEIELGNVLFRMGIQKDYWIDKINKVMKWSNSMYNNAKVLKTDSAGAVCLLDTLSEAHRCPSGWTEHQDTCYLSLGTAVKSYHEGTALCRMADSVSRLVKVDTESENTFLSSLIGDGATLLLDLFYSPRHDDFIWSDGHLPIYTNWKPGYGRQSPANGSCAVLESQATYGQWRNTDCWGLHANLVCEMPAYV